MGSNVACPMFVDEVHNIKLKAGDGGDGCLSFHRAKFIPKGGPNGGDGGRGGDVILIGDENTNDLSVYRFKPHAHAKNGEHGMGSQMHGKNGANCLLKVPVGTVVVSAESKAFVAEIISHEQRVVLLNGGNGGKGNIHFKSSTNQAPRQTTPGMPGESGTFDFILKTIADIGLVGYPNAGKSTLLGMLTSASPRVGNYPFTTLHANVGVMQEGSRSIFIADIPGIIDGAHENRGLGIRFLKHIERCSSLLFLIDMSGIDNRSPIDDYKHLLEELGHYDKSLLNRRRIIVANKMDIDGANENLVQFKKVYGDDVIEISCADKEGFDVLKNAIKRSIIE